MPVAVETLFDLFRWFLLGWFLCLAALVLIPVMQGRLGGGMLQTGPGGARDPERVLLLFSTMGVALYYVVHTLGADIEELRRADGTYWMPDLPQEMLVLLFGSQGGYLYGKIMKMNKDGRGA